MKAAARRLFLLSSCLALTGCVRAPSFNILGSYFPAWMLCLLVGIVLTVILRLLVQRLGWEGYVWPAVLTYPCAAAFFTFSLWLLLFS